MKHLDFHYADRLGYITPLVTVGNRCLCCTRMKSSTTVTPVSHHEPLLTLIKTNDKECLLGFHNVFCIINLINCIVQNKWAE